MKKYLLVIFLLFLFAKMPAAGQNMDLRQPFCSGFSVSSDYLYPGDSISMTASSVSYSTRVRFAMTPKSNPQCQGGSLTHDFGLAGSSYNNTGNINFSSNIPGSMSFYGKYTVFANPAIVAGEDNLANRTDFPYSWISTSNPKAKSDAVWCSNVSSDKTCDAQYCWAGTAPGGQLLCTGDQCDSEAEVRDLNVLSNNISCTSDVCVVSPSLCGVRECGKVTTDDGLCDINCGSCPPDQTCTPEGFCVGGPTVPPTIPITPPTKTPTPTPTNTPAPTIPPPISCGATNTPGTYSICGYVFYDANSSRTRDVGETDGFPGLRMQLVTGELTRTVFGGGLYDPLYRMKRFAGAGWYEFNNLPPGTYSVTRIDDPTDGPYVETTANPLTGIRITNRDRTSRDFGLGPVITDTPTPTPTTPPLTLTPTPPVSYTCADCDTNGDTCFTLADLPVPVDPNWCANNCPCDTPTPTPTTPVVLPPPGAGWFFCPI